MFQFKLKTGEIIEILEEDLEDFLETHRDKIQVQHKGSKKK
jgi:hypothetical protein